MHGAPVLRSNHDQFGYHLMTPDHAMEVAQTFLDKNARAILSRKVGEVADMCLLPCRLETLNNKFIVGSREELESLCAELHDNLKSRQISDMVRTCLAAAWHDENTLIATYETRYLSGGKLLVLEPYLSLITLWMKDGRWKISSMQFATNGTEPASKILDDTLTSDWIGKTA